MLAFLLNSSRCSLDEIELKYFESGHTFMAADAMHSKIERAVARCGETESSKGGKVYDMNDFVECVRKAGCVQIEMQTSQFRNWQSGLSVHNLNKMKNRPHLSTMVRVAFHRGSEKLFYQCSFAGEGERSHLFLKKNLNP